MITASREKLLDVLENQVFARMFLIQKKGRSNNSQSSYSQKHCALWLSWKKSGLEIPELRLYEIK